MMKIKKTEMLPVLFKNYLVILLALEEMICRQ